MKVSEVFLINAGLVFGVAVLLIFFMKKKSSSVS
jgi:hypothetical protein